MTRTVVPIRNQEDISRLVRGDFVEFYPNFCDIINGVKMYLGTDELGRCRFMGKQANEELYTIEGNYHQLRVGPLDTLVFQERVTIAGPQEPDIDDVILYESRDHGK